MAASKSRLRWHELPDRVRAEVERVSGDPVVAARSCAGGFSPGLASQLHLADGRRVFVKAVDAGVWPGEAAMHRTEAQVTSLLPETAPVPRLLSTLDDGHWIVLVFECIDGVEPIQPWNEKEIYRVLVALRELARTLTPSPVPVPRDHPRLGGWAELAGDTGCRAQLSVVSPWASEHLDRLIGLEIEGLAAAHGDSLVHFDLYPHNIMLTEGRVVFVDWPHARLADPAIDVIQLLTSAAADGLDPEPLLATATQRHRTSIDALLAAQAGFLLAGGLSGAPPGLEAIPKAKLRLGLGALHWLRRRLAG